MLTFFDYCTRITVGSQGVTRDAVNLPRRRFTLYSARDARLRRSPPPIVHGTWGEIFDIYLPEITAGAVGCRLFLPTRQA